jgi:hypothetical protein
VRDSDPPWVKDSLRILIDDRDNAYHNKQTLKYIRLKEKVIAHARELKANYLNDNLMQSNSLAHQWSSIKQICGIRKSNTKVMDVDAINLMFANVFQCDDCDLDASFDDLSSEQLCVSEQEVYKLLTSLKNGAPGLDGLPPWVYRVHADYLSGIISNLINESLTMVRMPQILKNAQVCPIPKNKECTEFRSISLLPVLAKIYEKVVRDKWIIPSVKGKMDPLQFAFAPNVGLGTQNALVLMSHRILHWLDKPGAVRILLLDFRKAFDLVLRSRILAALSAFGVSRECWLWIADFLTDRQQRVAVGENVSEWAPITSGVPQGSILGPILFSIVIDNLKPSCEKLMYIKYADDISVLNFVRNSDDDCINNELNHIIKWARNSRFSINWDKTFIMDYCTSSKILLSKVITPQGEIISVMNNARVLGIKYSNDMKWSLHIDNVVKSAHGKLSLLSLLSRSGCSTDWLWKVYFAFIRSTLTYAYPAWCSIPATLLCRLQRIENRASRLIGSRPSVSLDTFLERLCRRLAKTIIAAAPLHPLTVVFNARPHRSVLLRESTEFTPVFARTTRLKKSFTKYASCN